jgi:hypothetical protein
MSLYLVLVCFVGATRGILWLRHLSISGVIEYISGPRVFNLDKFGTWSSYIYQR